MSEPSPLPPRLRDTRSYVDRIRQDRTNLKQLGVGFVGGRFSPARPLGATALYGDIQDDTADEALGFRNTDRVVTTGASAVRFPLTFLPVDGSEHVTWHPNGGGGIRLEALDWVRNDQVITIPAFAGLAAGDVFTCEYAYLLGDEPEPIDPSVVGYTAPGVVNGAGTTTTFDIPPGTASGDLLVLSMRGKVAPGGGEVVDTMACTDPRLSLAYSAVSLNSGHLIMESIWLGVADASGSPVVVNTNANGGAGVLATIAGANGWGTVSAVESGSAIPTISAIAALAVVWMRANPVAQAAAPSTYTDIAATPANYFSTDLSFWFDPGGTISPSGMFVGEGCCVIAII